MYPECKVTMPLEAQAYLAEGTEQWRTATGNDQQRLQEMETELQRQHEEMEAQRRDIQMQQHHVTQVAMAQQQQQEMLSAAQQRLIQEHQAMTGQSVRVPNGDSDIDLCSTP